jgi:hypothetical protein
MLAGAPRTNRFSINIFVVLMKTLPPHGGKNK